MEQHLSGVSSTCCSHTSAIFVLSDVHQQGEDREDGGMICSPQLLLQPEVVNRQQQQSVQLWVSAVWDRKQEETLQTAGLASSPWKQLMLRCVTSDSCPTVAY